MNIDTKTPFQTIERAATITGLSRYYLRTGCKAGRVPHIMTGAKYLVNVPALLEQIDRESREAVRDNG